MRVEKTVRAYLASVGDVCADVLGENLEAIWVGGSLATGDFDTRRSDVDLLVISKNALLDDDKTALGQRLRHSSLQCPGHGLDLLVYRAPEIAVLPRVPHYEFSMASGIEWDDEISRGGPYPGGIIDLALAHQCGVPLLGSAPRDTMTRCPEVWIVEELRNGVEWHKTRIHDPFHDPSGANAVLNACRALYFLSRRVLASKSAGAEWLLSTRPTPVVAKALSQRQEGTTTDRLDAAEVLDFLDVVEQRFGLVGGQPWPQGVLP